MKFPPRNTAPNQLKKHPVFSDKMMGNIRIKLKQFAEIEYLLHTQNQTSKKAKNSK